LPRVDTSTGGGPTTGVGGIGSAINVDGPFTFKTSGHWAATVELQRNEDENGWETYRSWTSTISNGVGSLNAQYTGIEYQQNVQYRIRITSYDSGSVTAHITVNSSTQSGIVKITNVSNSYTADCTVISKIASINQTKQWHEGAWSGVRGYPKTVCIFQDRCIYAGTTHQPQTMWHSESGAYDIIT